MGKEFAAYASVLSDLKLRNFSSCEPRVSAVHSALGYVIIAISMAVGLLFVYICVDFQCFCNLLF